MQNQSENNIRMIKLVIRCIYSRKFCNVCNLMFSFQFIIEPKGLDRPIKLQLPIMIATYPARNKDGTLKRRSRLPAYPALLPVFRSQYQYSKSDGNWTIQNKQLIFCVIEKSFYVNDFKMFLKIYSRDNSNFWFKHSSLTVVTVSLVSGRTLQNVECCAFSKKWLPFYHKWKCIHSFL